MKNWAFLSLLLLAACGPVPDGAALPRYESGEHEFPRVAVPIDGPRHGCGGGGCGL